MNDKRKTISVWLTKIITHLVKGTLWLFDVIPLTALLFLPIGVISILTSFKADVSPNILLTLLTVTLLIDGYFGHKRAEEKEQKIMNDFYSWHFKELKENSKQSTGSASE
jgi:hypothetical protein